MSDAAAARAARDAYVAAHMRDVPASWTSHMPATVDQAALATAERLIRAEMKSVHLQDEVLRRGDPKKRSARRR